MSFVKNTEFSAYQEKNWLPKYKNFLDIVASFNQQVMLELVHTSAAGCRTAHEGPSGEGLLETPPTRLGFSICLAWGVKFCAWTLSSLDFNKLVSLAASW